MKRSILKVLLFTSVFGFSQEFTWMRGAAVHGTITGVYGTQGSSSPGNDPGTRHGAATWTDAAGNLWMFGGEGISATATLSWLNDLWKYDLTTKEWTWMRGLNAPNALGVYGTQGVSSPANDPGAREFAAYWTDANGNFWLFGGDGFGSANLANPPHRLNDLWKYDPGTNEWTWVSGSSSADLNGTYGTLGTPAASNMPGSRYWPATWTSLNGDLWMFGGLGFPATGTVSGHLNDLWRYKISSNQWTWMGGSNVLNTSGVYGTLGVPAASNMPGGREMLASWNDGNDNLYLFGGTGMPSGPNNGYLNDLWKYSISSNQWTWLSGSNASNQSGQYGSLGVSSGTNTPGGRHSPASWRDPSGNLWLFGGIGWTNSVIGNLNDLWKYSPVTNEWTWVKGAQNINEPGVYGTMGVPSATNMPGGRHYITHWKKSSSTFWLFGGLGVDSTHAVPFDNMNDLWGYAVCKPDTVTAASSTAICSGQSVTLTASNQYSSTIQWYPNSSGTTSVGNGSVLIVTPGNTTTSSLYYYPESSFCPATPRKGIQITLYALPVLSVSATKTLLCGNAFQSATITATGAQSYTWSTNTVSSAIVFTTNYQNGGVHTLTVNGTDTHGCKNAAAITLTVELCGGIAENFVTGLRVYPNPNNGNFAIELSEVTGPLELIILNSLGQKIFQQELKTDVNEIQSDLKKGLYFYQVVKDGASKARGRLIVE